MKKRIPALMLSATVLLNVQALAAGSTGHFSRTKTYTGQFSDLSRDSTFYSNVAALYEYGLSVGKADGTFGLEDPLTVGQIVLFAGRIRSLYQTGDPESGPSTYRTGSGPAALPYLLYLQAEGVLGTEWNHSLSSAASRAQVAHVLSRVLPREDLPLINDDLVTQAHASRKFISDVTGRTEYAQDILTLYRAGISMGSNVSGSYLPDQPITRGAAAAMLTRMVDPALRVTPDWDLSRLWSAAGTNMSDLVPDGRYLAAPATDEEMDACIRYMLSRNQSRLSLQYGAISTAGARQVMDSALATIKNYVEQCYNTVACTYSSDGSIILEFSAAGAEGVLQQYRTSTMESAIAVHDQMWSSGQITTASTEYEKARIYYDWICDHCEYDYTAPDVSDSHIAYSLFQRGRAVCDGYTGAYNLLLKLEGIDCTALANSAHIWTVATLDGAEYHIDTTWGDSHTGDRNEFFAMTPAQSWQKHRW